MQGSEGSKHPKHSPRTAETTTGGKSLKRVTDRRARCLQFNLGSYEKQKELPIAYQRKYEWFMVIRVTDVCLPALHMDNQPCKMNKRQQNDWKENLNIPASLLGLMDDTVSASKPHPKVCSLIPLWVKQFISVLTWPPASTLTESVWMKFNCRQRQKCVLV